ncbi:hypothetical protein TNCV_3114741 [Trichonephila clavipes]|nr:hypothetical protein TNCV_3114741 [Trichonephila clavipes]
MGTQRYENCRRLRRKVKNVFGKRWCRRLFGISECHRRKKRAHLFTYRVGEVPQKKKFEKEKNEANYGKNTVFDPLKQQLFLSDAYVEDVEQTETKCNSFYFETSHRETLTPSTFS